MNEAWVWVAALLGGGALGGIFFGGLWWSVRKSLTSDRPALWIFASLLLRTGLTMTGFYLVAGGDWRRLLACLVGFVVARHIAIRLTRAAHAATPHAKPHVTQEARHAP